MRLLSYGDLHLWDLFCPKFSAPPSSETVRRMRRRFRGLIMVFATSGGISLKSS